MLLDSIIDVEQVGIRHVGEEHQHRQRMISRKQTAHILIAISLVGFAIVGIHTLWHAPGDAVVSGDSLIQIGVLMLSILLIATGSYLTGYRKGSRVTTRLTLDFSKKMDSSTKNSAL